MTIGLGSMKAQSEGRMLFWSATVPSGSIAA